MAILGLGLTVLRQGDYRRAAELYINGLEIIRRRGRPILFVPWLTGTAGVIRGLGKPTAAARLVGAVDALLGSFRTTGIERLSDRQLYDSILNQVRSELSAETFARLWQEGYAMDLEQAIEFALAEMKFSASPIAPASALFAPPSRERKIRWIDRARARGRRADRARQIESRDRRAARVERANHRGTRGQHSCKLDFSARSQIAVWSMQKGLVQSDGKPQ